MYPLSGHCLSIINKYFAQSGVWLVGVGGGSFLTFGDDEVPLVTLCGIKVDYLFIDSSSCLTTPLLAHQGGYTDGSSNPTASPAGEARPPDGNSCVLRSLPAESTPFLGGGGPPFSQLSICML